MYVHTYIYTLIHGHIDVTESLCCTPETNTMLLVNYTSGTSGW